MSSPRWSKDNKTFVIMNTVLDMPPPTRKPPMVLLFDIGGVCVRISIILKPTKHALNTLPGRISLPSNPRLRAIQRHPGRLHQLDHLAIRTAGQLGAPRTRRARLRPSLLQSLARRSHQRKALARVPRPPPRQTTQSQVQPGRRGGRVPGSSSSGDRCGGAAQ